MSSAFAVVPLLADADGNHMGGWDWGWMMGGWVAMILVVGLIVWALQGPRRPTGSGFAADAEEILAARFARGEIDADEYQERRSVLRG